jgi:hypothetical protein
MRDNIINIQQFSNGPDIHLDIRLHMEIRTLFYCRSVSYIALNGTTNVNYLSMALQPFCWTLAAFQLLGLLHSP